MEKKDLTQTMHYSTEVIHQENIRNTLKQVAQALDERGYNTVNQLAGYLITNDPAYISSHKNARSLIQQIERFEIIEELVRAYLSEE